MRFPPRSLPCFGLCPELQHGSFLLCPEGSHCAMWDDQSHYFPGLLAWLKRTDATQSLSR